MYESYFGFANRPFLAVPRTDRYFPGAAIEQARQNLTRCIERSEGCGLIIGPAGTGKTLLCQVLAEHFQDRLATVLLSNLRLTTRKELLQAILYEMGLPYRRLQEGELRLALIDRLTPNETCPHGMLLLVDEAHALSPQLFDELRMLTNLVRGGSPRVRLVIAGGTILEERLAHPKLASFSQRIVARCYLESFTASETIEYIRAQTAAAGVDPDRLWSESASRSIHQVSDGCPRLINQVCDLALILAAEAGAESIDATGIEAAWAELQQLPTSLDGDRHADTNDAGDEDNPNRSVVIEFGDLEDDVVSEAQPDTYRQDDSVADDGNELLVVSNDPVLPEPEMQLDEIDVHLADAQTTFGDSEQHENAKFMFSEVAPESVEPTQQIVINDFDGIDCDNVLHMSPAPNAVVGNLPDETDEDNNSAPPDASTRVPQASWQETFDHEADQDHNVYHELPFGNFDIYSVPDPLMEVNYEDVGMNMPVDLSNEDRDTAAPERPLAAAVVEFAEKPDISGCETRECDLGPDSIGSSESESVEPTGEVVADDATPIETFGPQHPSIPIRQRQYRQLFAMLHERRQVTERNTTEGRGLNE